MNISAGGYNKWKQECNKFCFFSHSHNWNSLNKKEIGEIYEQVVNLSMHDDSFREQRPTGDLAERGCHRD